jgi:hypothetical protein
VDLILVVLKSSKELGNPLAEYECSIGIGQSWSKNELRKPLVIKGNGQSVER